MKVKYQNLNSLLADKENMINNLHALYQAEEYQEFLKLYEKFKTQFGENKSDTTLYFEYGKSLREVSCNTFSKEANALAKMAISVFIYILKNETISASLPCYIEIAQIQKIIFKNYESAESYVLRYLECSMTDKQKEYGYRVLVDCYMREGKYALAEEMLNKLLLVEPINYKYIPLMGNALFKQKKYAGAVSYYQKYLAIYSDDYENHFNLGKVYLAMKMFDKAESEFLLCKKSAPLKINTQIELGNLYQQTGRYLEALEILKNCFYMSNSHYFKAKSLKYLGDTSTKLRNNEKAEEYYLKALKYYPSFTGAYFGLSNLYKKWGKNIDAKEMEARGIAIEERKMQYFLNQQAEISLENSTDYKKGKRYEKK